MLSMKLIWGYLRAIFASLIWIYAILKLFVFDIDIFFVNITVPKYTYLLDYKFFFLALMFVSCWQIFGIWRVMNFFGYVFAFPAKWIGWKIPLKIYNQRGSIWFVLYINNLFALIRRSRGVIWQLLIMLIALIIVITSHNSTILCLTIFSLALQLAFHYYGRFSLITNPLSYIFISPSEIESVLLSTTEVKDKSIENLDRSSNITVLFASLFALKLMKNGLGQFTKKSIYAFYIMAFVVMTYFIALFDVTLINVAIYKIDPSQYKVDNTSAASWIIYSAASMLFNGSQDIAYAGTFSRYSFLGSGLFGIIFVGLLFGILSGIITERNKEGLQDYIEHIDDYDKKLTEKAIKEYKLTVEEVSHRITDIGGKFGDFIKKFEEIAKQSKESAAGEEKNKKKRKFAGTSRKGPDR